MPVQQTINIDKPSEIQVLSISFTINDLCADTSITLTDEDSDVTLLQDSIIINSSFGTCEQLEGTGEITYRNLEIDCNNNFVLSFKYTPGVIEVTFDFNEDWQGSLITACDTLTLPTTENETIYERPPRGFSTVGSETVHSDNCFYYFYLIKGHTLYRSAVPKEGNVSLFSNQNTGFSPPLSGAFPVGDMLLKGNLLYLFPLLDTDIIVVDITDYSIVKTIPFVNAVGAIKKVGNFVYCFPKQEGLNTGELVYFTTPYGSDRIIKFNLTDDTFTTIPLDQEYECHQVLQHNDNLYSVTTASNVIIKLDTTNDNVTYLTKSSLYTNYNVPGFSRIIGDYLFYAPNDREAMIKRNLITDVETQLFTGASPGTPFGTWNSTAPPPFNQNYKIGDDYYFTFRAANGDEALKYEPSTDTYSMVPFSWTFIPGKTNPVRMKTNLVSTPTGDFWGDNGKYQARRDTLWIYDPNRTLSFAKSRNFYKNNETLYIITTNTNQINLTGLNVLNFQFTNASFNNSSTFIGILVSFDNRNNWGILTDSNTFTILVNNSNLPNHNWFSTIGSSSMTVNSLQTLNNIDVTVYNSLDIAIAMKTNSLTGAPSIESLNVIATQ